MISSFGPSKRYRQSGEADSQSAPVKQRRFKLKSYRMVLSVWAALSALWVGCVVYDVYLRAQTQAQMSRDVERDLDQGLTSISCTGPQCGVPMHDEPDRWPDIASTYLRFGRVEMGEFVFVPPGALLVTGLGIAFVAKRRRRSA